jgi:peroxiredoxin
MKITRAVFSALGALLLTASMSQAAIQVGSKIEPITLKDMDGKDVTIKFDKKVNVVSFWVSTCTLCKEELKTLNQLAEKYKDASFNVVSTDFGGPRIVNAVLKMTETQNKIPIVFDQSSEVATRKYGITRFPFLMFVNKEGQVIWYNDGWEADAAQRISSELEYRLK